MNICPTSHLQTRPSCSERISSNRLALQKFRVRANVANLQAAGEPQACARARSSIVRERLVCIAQHVYIAAQSLRSLARSRKPRALRRRRPPLVVAAAAAEPLTLGHFRSCCRRRRRVAAAAAVATRTGRASASGQILPSKPRSHCPRERARTRRTLATFFIDAASLVCDRSRARARADYF